MLPSTKKQIKKMAAFIDFSAAIQVQNQLENLEFKNENITRSEKGMKPLQIVRLQLDFNTAGLKEVGSWVYTLDHHGIFDKGDFLRGAANASRRRFVEIFYQIICLVMGFIATNAGFQIQMVFHRL